MKKILALLLAVLMVASLAACAGDDKKTDGGNKVTLADGTEIDIDIPSSDGPVAMTLKVWGPTEDIGDGKWLTEQTKAFAEANKDKYDITWQIEVCSEGDAATNVTTDPETAAHVYMYASDQLGTLINAGALSQLGGAALEQVQNDNEAWSLNTVTYIDGNVYGFPVCGNTWFMYYNKSLVSDEEAKSLEAMLAKTQVAFDWGNGWYNGAFFFGAGGTLFGPNGLDAAAGVDYKGATGVAVAQRMVELYNAGMINGGGGADMALFQEGKVGAFFSGSWNYQPLLDTLGDDLGIAVLPSFTVGENTYNMKAFAGTKCAGVNAQIKNPIEAKAANELAAFLASKDSQKLHFDLRSISPTHKELANDATIMAHPVCATELAVYANYSVIQPGIPEMGNYWTPMGTFGGNITNGEMTVENAGDLLTQTLAQMNK